jgi:hypothetical protein
MVTEGEVESLAVVQNGPVDDVYFSVKRVVNGATKRYIEVLMPDEGELDTDIFSDCTVVKSNPKEITDITLANPGVVTAPAHGFSNGDMVIIKDSMSKSEFNNRTYKVSNATTNTFELDGIDTSGYLMYNSIHTVMKLQYSVSDLDHLEGKTVQIKCDGATHPNLVVSSGVITLQEPAGEVTVGLAYNMSVTTLPLEYQSAEGDTNYGQPSRRPRPILKVYRSSYPNLNNQVPASRNTRDYMDSKVPLFTGNIKYSSTAWGDDSQINITSSEPLPVTIIGIYGTVEGNVK